MIVSAPRAAVARRRGAEVTQLIWRGLAAFTLSDRRSESLVVRQLGDRAVSYGLKDALIAPKS